MRRLGLEMEWNSACDEVLSGTGWGVSKLELVKDEGDGEVLWGQDLGVAELDLLASCV